MTEDKPLAEPVAKKTAYVTWGPAVAIAFTLVVYFFTQILASIVLLAYAKIRGWDQATITSWTNTTVVQFAYVLLIEAATIGLVWWFVKRLKSSVRAIGLVKPKLRDIGYAFVGFGIYLPSLIVATLLITHFGPHINLDQQQQLGFESANNVRQLALVFMSLVVLPPLAEEILVRGFLYSGLKKKLPLWWAVVITSGIFAIAHLQIGSGAPLLWSAAIDTFILSLVLIYLREKTGSLWASIGLHMIKNLVAFSALFLFK